MVPLAAPEPARRGLANLLPGGVEGNVGGARPTRAMKIRRAHVAELALTEVHDRLLDAEKRGKFPIQELLAIADRYDPETRIRINQVQGDPDQPIVHEIRIVRE